MDSFIKFLCILLVFAGCFAGSFGGDEARLLDYLFSNYSPLVRPGGHETLAVQQRYDLIRIVELDVHKQVLTLDVWEWLHWKDERLVWDKVDYPVDMVRVPPSMIWLPDLEIYNSAAPVEEKLQKHIVFIDSTGGVMQLPYRQIKPYCDVGHHIAAGDHVTCNITIGSWSHDSSDLDLQLYDNEALKMGMLEFSDSNRNWAVESTNVVRNIKKFECCPQEYVNVDYVITLKRKNHMSCP